MSDGRPRHRQRRPGNKISTPAGQMVVALRKGGRSTSTPAAETGTVVGDGGAEEIGSGSGGDSGGAAEEMDQDGSGGGGLSDRAHAENWLTMTRQQRKNWKQRSGRA